MKRRNSLKTATAIGAISLYAEPLDKGKLILNTPTLSVENRDSIASVLGKKGTYIKVRATYTVLLPRPEINVTVKGGPVSVPFGTRPIGETQRYETLAISNIFIDETTRFLLT